MYIIRCQSFIHTNVVFGQHSYTSRFMSFEKFLVECNWIPHHELMSVMKRFSWTPFLSLIAHCDIFTVFVVPADRYCCKVLGHQWVSWLTNSSVVYVRDSHSISSYYSDITCYVRQQISAEYTLGIIKHLCTSLWCDLSQMIRWARPICTLLQLVNLLVDCSCILLCSKFIQRLVSHPIASGQFDFACHHIICNHRATV